MCQTKYFTNRMIPGTDIYDTSRVYSGFPIGTQLHQGSTFGSSLLTGQQVAGSIPTTPTLFTGQQSFSERPTNLEFAIPQYQQVYNANVSIIYVIRTGRIASIMSYTMELCL